MTKFLRIEKDDYDVHATDLIVGPLSLSADAVMLRLFGQHFGVHVDHYWSKEVRSVGAPERLYLNAGPLGMVMIGLPTNHEMLIEDNRVVDLHAKADWHWTRAQSWSPFRGYALDRCAVITFTPPRWLLCRADSPPHTDRFGGASQWQCAAIKGHRGRHTWEYDIFPFNKTDWSR